MRRRKRSLSCKIWKLWEKDCENKKDVINWNQKKEQPPTRWVDLNDWIERPPYQPAKVKRVVFSMFVYLQNVKTNVSKAIRKSPKDNKSWKSNLFRFFISSTSILQGMKVNTPCNTIVPWVCYNTTCTTVQDRDWKLLLTVMDLSAIMTIVTNVFSFMVRRRFIWQSYLSRMLYRSP